jgi:sugar phosphate isomerase/epimerase
MDKLNLRLLGLNQNHSFLDATQATDIREKNTVLARFLKGVEATYIGWEGIIVPAEESGGLETEEEQRRVARLAKVEGKKLWEEDGLKFTYHLQFTAGLGRLMDLTNSAHVHLNPDLGRLAARGGADVLQICQAYLSRIVAIHLKDYDPNLEFEDEGKHQKGGAVPSGSDVI